MWSYWFYVYFYTRKDIEEKKQELRRLVGARYRDLIDSADSIIQMRDLVKDLDAKMHQMEDLCDLVRKKRKRLAEEKKEDATEGIRTTTFAWIHPEILTYLQ